MYLTRSARKPVRVSHDLFWFRFWMDDKVARVFFTPITFGVQMKLPISQTVVLSFWRSSTVSVKVTLEDINDHAPIFDEQIYTVTATEGAAVNATILTVKVSEKKNLECETKTKFGHAGTCIKMKSVLPFNIRFNLALFWPSCLALVFSFLT